MKKRIVFALSVVLAFGISTALLGYHDGCTPGFWKNHLEAWGPTTYSPYQPLGSVFAFPTNLSDLAGHSLLQALKYPGGSGDTGAVRILLRTAVAALLNIAHYDVHYYGWNFGFKEVSDLVAAVNTALTGGRDAMLDLAQMLDTYNNMYCPLGD